MTAQDLRNLSLHEASHAVIALELGLDLESAQIDAHGGKTTALVRAPRTVAEAEKTITWSLAPHAIVAELTRRRLAGPSWFLGGSPWPSYRADAPGNEATDDARALEDARAVTRTESEARALVMRCHRWAVERAKSPLLLAAVQRVADELIGKRRLDAAEIRRLSPRSRASPT